MCLEDSLRNDVKGVFAGLDEYARADLREELGLPVPPRVPEAESDEDARMLDQHFAAMRMARRGLSNKQIARKLGVSAMTVSRITNADHGPSVRR